MDNRVIQTLDLFSARKEIDPRIIAQFKKRIMNGPITREDDPLSHVCAFFLPIHIPSGSIFLVHHKKANDWIPPGGHLDRNESPIQTVRREFAEELSFTLTSEPCIPFAATILPISNPRTPCRKHFDFWFLVAMRERASFAWDKREFHAAEWLPYRRAMRKTKQPEYAAIMSRLGLFFADKTTSGAV